MPQSGKFGFTNQAITLRQRVQKGGVLVLGGFGLSQFLRLGSNLILTRLLVPEAFGLMAAAVSISVLAIMMTDIGVNSSIVRSPNAEDPEFLRTAWTIKILRNFVVWGIVVLGALAVAYLGASGVAPKGSTFADPRLPWVMAACGAQLLISAFSSVNHSLAERRLLVVRTMFVEIGTQVVASTVTITAAFQGLGVWSLVLGLNAGAVFGLIASHTVFPGPSMRLRWSKAHVDEIFTFGKWLVLASLFGFMTNKGDHLIFGWALDSRHFGFYAIASIWVGIAANLFESIIAKLFYPAISEVVRDRPENIARVYRQSRLFLDVGAVLAAFGVFFFADMFLGVLYPEAFSGVSYYLKLLSPVILFIPYRMLHFVILSKGESKKFTLITFITGLSTLIFAPLALVVLGEKAGVMTFALIAGASLPAAWMIAGRIVPLDWRVEVRMLAAAALLLFLLFGIESPID